MVLFIDRQTNNIMFLSKTKLVLKLERETPDKKRPDSFCSQLSNLHTKIKLDFMAKRKMGVNTGIFRPIIYAGVKELFLY